MKKFDEKKERIKDAGRKMFAAYGYHKTTLDDIAGLMKLKKNSLYYYFPNKESLFLELIEDEVAVFLEKQKKILDKNIAVSKKIIQVLNELIHFVQQRAVKYSIRIESYLEMTKVLREHYPDFQKNQCKLIESLLNEGMACGELIRHNAKQLSRDIDLLITAVFNNYYRLSEAEFIYEVDFDSISKTVKRLISYIFDGIKK